MKKIINKKKGYALLFTMVIVSVIMVIATGISNSISKQLVLSGTAGQSQIAFYEADTAAECALYASQVADLILLSTLGTFDCGQDQNGNLISLQVTETSPGSKIYNFTPNLSLKGPCFKIEIDESGTPSVAQAYGYNICNASPTNRNVVERGIEITY